MKSRLTLKSIFVWIAVLLVVGVLVWQGVTAQGNPDPTVHGLTPMAGIVDTGVLVFREGLECILVLSAITASLVRTESLYWKPCRWDWNRISCDADYMVCGGRDYFLGWANHLGTEYPGCNRPAGHHCLVDCDELVLSSDLLDRMDILSQPQEARIRGGHGVCEQRNIRLYTVCCIQGACHSRICFVLPRRV